MNPIPRQGALHPSWMSRFQRWRRRRHPSRGQALVEMALVSVVLLLLLATVIDFGRLFYAQVSSENTARAGVIVASRAPSSYTGACSVLAAPTNKIGCAIAAETRGSDVVITPAEVTVGCENKSGIAVTCQSTPQPSVRSRVTVTKTFMFVMPVLSALFGSGLTMTASVAADQESLPPAATFIPVPSGTPAPTPTPTPTPAPTASPSPTPTPTPTPTAAPCLAGFAPMPNLVVGATPGSTETVAEARVEWQTAGFAPAKFNPSSGFTNKTVLTQSLTVGTCYATGTTIVTVTYG